MEIQKAGKISEGVSMIIYADNGLGKTHLIGSLPVGEVLILNIEGGMWTLKETGHHYIDITRDLKNLRPIYEAIRSGEIKYSNIAIDNFSAQEGFMLDVFLEEGAKDFYDRPEYRKTNQKMREWVRLYRDLTEQGMNVFITMWEHWEVLQNNSDGVISRCVPRVSKYIEAEICGLVNYVGHLEKDPKSDERYIRFQPNSLIKAKTRDSRLEELEEANLPKLLEKLK